MPTDHYIPRFLTKPWEHDERQLTYFDHGTRTFETKSSKKLFAQTDLTTHRVEQWLNTHVETPSARYVERLDSVGPVPAPKDTESRALALLFFLNGARVGESQNLRMPLTLDEAVSNEGLLDAAVSKLQISFQLQCIRMPRGIELFFTEAGFFAYPMPDAPIVGIPLNLRHVLIAYDGPLQPDQLLQHVKPDMLSVYSAGIGSKVNKVVLPPTWRAAEKVDTADVRRRLEELKSDARHLMTIIGRASREAGLRGWVPSD